MSQKEYSITGPLGGAVPGVVNMSVDAVSGSVRASTMTEDGGVIINQKTQVDIASSSTANLAVGAFFNGPAIADLNWTAVQYILKTDQNCFVYVEQSPDGINWDVSDQYDFYATGNGSSNTTQLTASYYRVRVQNVGAATTTFFRLQVIQIPFLNPLPRTLDPDGNLKCSIYEGITDESGFSTVNTPHGELLTAPSYRLIGSTFGYATLDSNFWTANTGTGGSATITNAELIISTGTTVNNSVSVNTVRAARFVGGTSNHVHTLMRFTDSGTSLNNTRRWGAYTATNGAFFTIINGVFGIVTRLNSIDTLISNGSFNGEKGRTIVFDANLHEFDIVYTVDAVYFYIDQEPLHFQKFSTNNWTSAYSLPVTLENINTGGNTTNISMITRHACIHRQGEPLTQPKSFFQQGLTAGVTLKNGAGNIHGMILSGITNNAVVIIYDNTAASGTVIWSSGSLVSNGLPFFVEMKGIPFSNGLTLAITTANCNCLVMYE